MLTRGRKLVSIGLHGAQGRGRVGSPQAITRRGPGGTRRVKGSRANRLSGWHEIHPLFTLPATPRHATSAAITGLISPRPIKPSICDIYVHHTYATGVLSRGGNGLFNTKFHIFIFTFRSRVYKIPCDEPPDEKGLQLLKMKRLKCLQDFK